MGTLGFLFEGVFWLLPAGLGVVLVGLWYVAYVIGRKREWDPLARSKALRLGRSLIPLLPLSGILGTVCGLTNTLSFMAEQAGGKIDIAQVAQRFSVALNTTIWGLGFALVGLALYETAIAKQEKSDVGK